MSKCISALGVVLVLFSTFAYAQTHEKFPGIGRTATPAEVAAWDIDVRPDFKGLPVGSGSVNKGQAVWDAKCASCHGTFGESNEVFTPIVGGTTKEDAKRGRVKALTEPTSRTTLMKVSSISTLWDYINRAMPWNAPKSLSTDEVYASLAYILYLADLVPDSFVLSNQNMAEAQQLLPNRMGKVLYQNLWDSRGKGDVINTACMSNCVTEMTIQSSLPEHARNAHGNLADQQRVVGPTRGVDTTSAAQNASSKLSSDALGSSKASAELNSGAAAALANAKKHNCTACHAGATKLVGPAFADVAAKYRSDNQAAARLAEKIRLGSTGVWGQVPMPPNTGVSPAESVALATAILSGSLSR